MTRPEPAPRLARLVAVVALVVTAAEPAGPTAGAKAPLDPRGRPDEKLVDQPQRYYVWHDVEGWHLRSAAKGTVKFEGAIRAVGGTFRKCRPIGLDLKGRLPDSWALDGGRTELKFLMHTSTSFDGFDFDLDRDATAVEFDLSIGGDRRPRRIFVGRDGRHPADATFRLPADPNKGTDAGG